MPQAKQLRLFPYQFTDWQDLHFFQPPFTLREKKHTGSASYNSDSLTKTSRAICLFAEWILTSFNSSLLASVVAKRYRTCLFIMRKWVQIPLGIGLFSSSIFSYFLQWSVLNQVPQGGSSLTVWCGSKKKWMPSWAAWGKTDSISSDWVKKTHPCSELIKSFFFWEQVLKNPFEAQHSAILVCSAVEGQFFNWFVCEADQPQFSFRSTMKQSHWERNVSSDFFGRVGVGGDLDLDLSGGRSAELVRQQTGKLRKRRRSDRQTSETRYRNWSLQSLGRGGEIRTHDLQIRLSF